MLRSILTILQVISAFVIVALVLLQRGKGADAGAGFGAGASGTVFGARVSPLFASKAMMLPFTSPAKTRLLAVARTPPNIK